MSIDDLIVIGAGWAGMAATAYAVECGAKVRLIAQGIGSMIVRPGWISVWDEKPGDLSVAIRDLAVRVPDHPYVLAGVDTIVNAIVSFCDLSETIGLNYVNVGMEDAITNHAGLYTALGKVQRVAAAPDGYFHTSHKPLFVGFEGWRDYYPMLSGPNTATICLPMADRLWDATPTDLARQFDKPDFRDAVAKLVKWRLNGGTSVGFPAVLGLETSTTTIIWEFGEMFGVPVFEIPTLPPSVPGTRLFNKMRRYFLDHGVRVQIGHPVTRGIIEDGRVVGVEVAAAGKPQRFYAKAVILATGGLYGGGLFSDDRGRIWEPIFDLPVSYDPDRTRWFNEDLLDPCGHPVHYFGVRVNDKMQPINAEGKPMYEGLHAIGRLLAIPQAANSPLPSECAEGVALATAYKAVTTALAAIALNSSPNVF